MQVDKHAPSHLVLIVQLLPPVRIILLKEHQIIKKLFIAMDYYLLQDVSI